MGFGGGVKVTPGPGWSLPSPEATRDALLLLLAATSGYVDAVSYLGLGRVFTANMTGDTVLLGLDLAQARGPAALRSAVALTGLVAGAALGTTIVEGEGERRSLVRPCDGGLRDREPGPAGLRQLRRTSGVPAAPAVYLLIAFSAIRLHHECQA